MGPEPDPEPPTHPDPSGPLLPASPPAPKRPLARGQLTLSRRKEQRGSPQQEHHFSEVLGWKSGGLGSSQRLPLTHKRHLWPHSLPLIGPQVPHPGVRGWTSCLPSLPHLTGAVEIGAGDTIPFSTPPSGTLPISAEVQRHSQLTNSHSHLTDCDGLSPLYFSKTETLRRVGSCVFKCQFQRAQAPGWR